MPSEDKTPIRSVIGGGQAGAAATATGRQISGNIAIQLGGRAIGIATALATVPITARTLGPEGFGVLTAGLAYVGIFGSFTELGLTVAAVNRMAAEPERESAWLGALTVLRAALSLLATATCIATIPLLLGNENDIAIVTFVLAFTILPGATSSFMAVFQTRLRAAIPQILAVGQSLLWLGTVITLALLDKGVVAFAVGYVVVAIALAVAQIAVTRRFVTVSWSSCWALLRPLVRLALPLGIAAVMILIYYRIDAVLLLKLSGAEEAGVYAVAYRLLEPLTVLPAIVMSTFFPVLSAVFEQDPVRARRLVQRCAEVMLAITLPCFAVSLALADPIVSLLFGQAYDRSASVLPILVGAFVSIGFGYLAGFLSPVLGLQWRFALYSTIGALANVGLNFVLIPPYGAYGSATATLITELLTMALMLGTALRVLRMRLETGRFARVLGAAAGMLIVMLTLRPLGLFLALAGGTAAYAGLILALKVVRPEEIRALRRPEHEM